MNDFKENWQEGVDLYTRILAVIWIIVGGFSLWFISVLFGAYF